MSCACVSVGPVLVGLGGKYWPLGLRSQGGVVAPLGIRKLLRLIAGCSEHPLLSRVLRRTAGDTCLLCLLADRRSGQISSSGDLLLGASYGGSNPFSGYIDDARVYDSALTEAQLANLLAGATGIQESVPETLSGSHNRLKFDGRYQYTYDQQGNRSTRIDHQTGEIVQYSWDVRNRLTSVTTLAPTEQFLLRRELTASESFGEGIVDGSGHVQAQGFLNSQSSWVSDAPPVTDLAAGNSLDGGAALAGTEDPLLLGNGDFSMAMWFKPQGTTQQLAKLNDPVGGSHPGYLLVYDNTGASPELQFTVHDGTSSVALTATVANLTGAWHHVAATRDQNGNIALYLDGTLLQTSGSMAPQISNVEGSGLVYQENNATTALSSTLTLADGDDTNLQSATISLSSGYIQGEDVLEVIGTLPTGISTTGFDAGTGVISLSGAATVAAYQQALRQIGYRNTSDHPATTQRMVSWTVNDGTADSNTPSRGISITRLNDTPIAVALSDTSLTKNQPAGTAVGTLSTTDPDLSDSHTYSIISDPDSAFQLVGDQLQTSTVLDFSGQSSYSVTIRTTDSGSATYDQVLTITEDLSPVIIEVTLSQAISSSVQDDLDDYQDHLDAGMSDTAFTLSSLGLTLIGYTAFVTELHYGEFVGTYENVIVGNHQNETLYGTADDDLIFGRDGSDTLYGYGGNDIFIGGNGKDIQYGGTGDDVFLVTGGDSGHDQYDPGSSDGFDQVIAVDAGTTIRVDGYDDTVERFQGHSSGDTIIRDNYRGHTLDFSQTELVDIAEVHAFNGGDTVIASDLSPGFYRGGEQGDTLIAGDQDVTWLFSGSDNGYDTFQRSGTGTITVVAETAGTIIGIKDYNNEVDVFLGHSSGDTIIRDNHQAHTLDFSQTELVEIAEVHAFDGGDTVVASNLSAGFYRGGEHGDTLISGDQDVTWLYSGSDNGYDTFQRNGSGRVTVVAETAGTVIGVEGYDNEVDLFVGHSSGDTIIKDQFAAHTLDFTQTAVVDITQVVTGSGDTLIAFDTNQAPMLTIPGNQTVASGGSLALPGISIEDLDAPTQEVAMTLSVTSGSLTLADTTGLTFTSGGAGQSSMTFTGTLVDVNAALAGLSYTSNLGSTGTDTLSVTVDDQGNTGTGGAKTDSDSLSITITTSSQTPPVYSVESLEFGTDGGTGVIADVRLYNQVLSQSQITALQTSAAPLYEISQTVEYIYDLANRRIGKEVDQDGDGMVDHRERYVWDVVSPDGKGNVVLDFVDEDLDGEAEGSELSRRYLWGNMVDQLFAQENVDDLVSAAAADVDWMLTDNLGTIRDVVRYDEVSGTTSVAEHFTFGAFGDLTSGDASITRYLFTGQEYDADLGLYYYDQRWYDAGTGQFLSPDPVEDDRNNTYRYVGNNPTNAVDPSGLHPPDKVWVQSDDNGVPSVYHQDGADYVTTFFTIGLNQTVSLPEPTKVGVFRRDGRVELPSGRITTYNAIYKHGMGWGTNWDTFQTDKRYTWVEDFSADDVAGFRGALVFRQMEMERATGKIDQNALTKSIDEFMEGTSQMTDRARDVVWFYALSGGDLATARWLARAPVGRVATFRAAGKVGDGLVASTQGTRAVKYSYHLPVSSANDAITLASKWLKKLDGEDIPDYVNIVFRPPSYFKNPDINATWSATSTLYQGSTKKVRWSEFLKQGKIEIVVNRRVLRSPAATVGAIRHELYEIKIVKELMENQPVTEGELYDMLWTHVHPASGGYIHRAALQLEVDAAEAVGLGVQQIFP